MAAAPVVLTPQREAVVALLRAHGEKVADEADFSFHRIGEGRGFCSLLYGVRLGDVSYAVKITNPAGEISGAEGSVGLHQNVHARECDFYEWAAKLPVAGAGEKPALEKIARTFGGRKCGDAEGLLIMEDFSDRLCGSVDFTKGYSVELIRDILRAIARYQRAFLRAPVKFAPGDKAVVHEALKGMAASCIGALKESEWLPKGGERRSALLKAAENVAALQDAYPAYAKGLPLTLAHCDLWPNNMLFEQKGDAPATLLAIVDWQCATVGNALLDVASAIGVCLTPEARRAHEQELIDFYLAEMDQAVDRDTVVKVYRHSLKWAALQLVFTAVFNPTADAVEEGESDGPLSRRLKAIIEDIELE